ncbi:MAG: HNH endonuclease, partial [Rhodobacteraceae bacterium]|nr:HNH endonuclease [Paracoccaceae bacterium]
DLELFFDLDKLQSVCWTYYSGDIQSLEAYEYDSNIGVDGWPTGPKHPCVA